MRKNKRMATFLKFSIMGIRSFDKKISVWELLKVWEHPFFKSFILHVNKQGSGFGTGQLPH
jgi:hypothetical protein